MGISISVNGMTELEIALGKAINSIKTNKMLNEIGTDLVDSTVERFETESDAEGRVWVNSPAVMAIKRKRGDTKVLAVTGRLKNSITKQVKMKSLKVGTNVEYGKYLQEGTKKMKAKPFLGISDEDKENIKDIVKKHFGGIF